MNPPEPSRAGRRVLGATFVTLGLAYGIWYSYSVFLVAVLREFGWSRSLAAGAFSVLVLVHGFAGPLLGWLAGRIGPRRVVLLGGVVFCAGLLLAAEVRQPWHFYASFGVLVGLGISGAGWVPSVLLVRGWFPRRIGTAVGVASAGIGVGIFALVPLAQFLVDAIGLRWALRALAAGAGAWILGATGWLLRDPPRAPEAPLRPPADQPTPAAPHWTVAAALRSWRFWSAAGVFFAGSFASQMLLVHQVAYLVDQGVAALAAASVGGVVGLASIGGKLAWGALSDRVGREPTYSLAFVCVLAAIAVLAVTGRDPASPLPYVYGVLIGVGYAATAPLSPAVASDLFSGPRFSLIFGLLHSANSLGGASGAWAAGALFDRTGSYTLALWAAAAMAVLAPTLLWIAGPRRPNPPPRAPV